jgi:hypothetical protein
MKSKEQKATLRALDRRRLLDCDSDEFCCVMHNLILCDVLLIFINSLNFMELIPLMFFY